MNSLLECRKISKIFGGIEALTKVDLTVAPNSITGVIGPNGAGKTTLFNIISGALVPTEGEVIFKRKKISGMGPARVCRLGVARTYQLVRPFNSLSAIENVLIGLAFGRTESMTKKDRVAEAFRILQMVGLEKKINHVAEGLTLVEKKHLEIARALATAPEILLLDEVVSGLNPTEVTKTVETIQQIQESGITVIMIEHILKVVMALCERVVVLNYGVQIAEGPPKAVVRNEAVIEAYIGKFEDDGGKPHA
ncbi:MAG: ABC transporter ATP-binding protein [Deltaproteobacteria bacterium]|nr:ABC transporter ATP-binding protein [Deltaproteobacteria bacterium]